MSKNWKSMTFMVAMMMVMLPTLSVQAQEEVNVYPSIRFEPGVAIPVGSPQDDRFTVGGSIAVKPELNIADIFSFGPSASVTAFQSEILKIDTPAIWTAGGFIRIKRPHSFTGNPDTGAASVSPWIDGDLQYVRTGELDRIGGAVAVGAAWPIDEDRIFWMGPFVRYQNVRQGENVVGFNVNDSHTIIVGLSLELGAAQKRPALPVEEKPEPVKPTPPAPPVPAPPAPPAIKYVDMQLSQVIQFAYDSDKLDAVATGQLDAVIAKINGAKSYKAIKIDGHASAEPPKNSAQAVHNDKLSNRRAQSVVEYLAAHGISREKLVAVGFGSQVPTATNVIEAGRVKNRRAEFVVNFVIVQEMVKK